MPCGTTSTVHSESRTWASMPAKLLEPSLTSLRTRPNPSLSSNRAYAFSSSEAPPRCSRAPTCALATR